MIKIVEGEICLHLIFIIARPRHVALSLGFFIFDFASGRDKNVHSNTHTVHPQRQEEKNTWNAERWSWWTNERVYIMHTDCFRKILSAYTFCTERRQRRKSSAGWRMKRWKYEEKSIWNDIFKRIQFNFKLNYLFANFIESILFISHILCRSSAS